MFVFPCNHCVFCSHVRETFGQVFAVFHGYWETPAALELWRCALRRYLWLDILHETIEMNHTMSGKRSSKKTENELRREVAERQFYFTPDAPAIVRWELFQVLVLIFTAIIVPLRAGFDQIDL